MRTVTCLHCGHANPADAKTCALCRKPLGAVEGIHRPACCPHCGSQNPAGTVGCLVCGRNLVKIEQLPESARTAVCPRCGAPTLPFLVGQVVYCVACGCNLDPALAHVSATPDADACPICDARAVRLKDIAGKRVDPRAGAFTPPGKPLPLWLFGTEPHGAADDALSTLAAAQVQGGLGAASVVADTVQEGGLDLSAVGDLSGELVAGLAAIAAGLTLLAINEVREDIALQHQEARGRWSRAYYCPTDRIVFLRDVNAVEWVPADRLSELILRS